MLKRDKVIGIIDKTNESVASVICYGVPILGFLLLYEVIMRYVFTRPTIWVHDISQFLFGALYMLGAGYTLLKRRHVNMDMLYSRFSKRGKALVDAVTGVLFLIFIGVVIWNAWIMAYESVLFNEHLIQSVFEPPLYPIKIIFLIGCILFMLQGLAHLVRDLITVFGGIEPTETTTNKTEAN